MPVRPYLMPIILLGLATGAAAASTCDDPIAAQKTLDQRSQHVPLPSAHLRILNLQLGVDDLERVQKELGETKPLARKEHAAARLCYTGPQSSGPVVLFEAGALGGWHRITAFCVITGREAEAIRRHCATTPKIATELSTDGGLKPGQSLSSTRALFGKPTFAKRDKDSYWFTTRTQQNMDVTEYVGIRRLNGKVTGFKISRVETN